MIGTKHTQEENAPAKDAEHCLASHAWVGAYSIARNGGVFIADAACGGTSTLRSVAPSALRTGSRRAQTKQKQHPQGMLLLFASNLKF